MTETNGPNPHTYYMLMLQQTQKLRYRCRVQRLLATSACSLMKSWQLNTRLRDRTRIGTDPPKSVLYFVLSFLAFDAVAQYAFHEMPSITLSSNAQYKATMDMILEG